MDLLYPKPTKLQKNLLQFFSFFQVGLETILCRMNVEMEYLDLSFFFFEAYGLQCFNFFVGRNICRKLQFHPPTFNNSQSDFFKCSKFGGGKRRKISIFKLFPRWKWITSNSNVGSVWCVLAFWQSFLSSFRLILENTHRSLLICIIAFTYEGDCWTLNSFQFHWIELVSLVLSALYHTQEKKTTFLFASMYHFMKCFISTWNFLIIVRTVFRSIVFSIGKAEYPIRIQCATVTLMSLHQMRLFVL